MLLVSLLEDVGSDDSRWTWDSLGWDLRSIVKWAIHGSDSPKENIGSPLSVNPSLHSSLEKRGLWGLHHPLVLCQPLGQCLLLEDLLGPAQLALDGVGTGCHMLNKLCDYHQGLNALYLSIPTGQ